MITKKNLEYLEELARMGVSEKDERKLLLDLEHILNYFEELKEVDTREVLPMMGGALLQNNVVRGDDGTSALPRTPAIGQFPEEEKGFLKIPPVFE